MDLDLAHRLAREKGTNMVAYWVARGVMQPFFHLYFRIRRIGRDHIPAEGPTIIAANHRSFSDPFLIGICTTRPLRFVAKVELFKNPIIGRVLVWLGAFPIRRGSTDEQAMRTARIILERGGVLAISPEGTRVRPGPLGRPRSGVGQLALAVTARVWPCIELQWLWLGGEPPPQRPTIVAPARSGGDVPEVRAA